MSSGCLHLQIAPLINCREATLFLLASLMSPLGTRVTLRALLLPGEGLGPCRGNSAAVMWEWDPSSPTPDAGSPSTAVIVLVPAGVQDPHANVMGCTET